MKLPHYWRAKVLKDRYTGYWFGLCALCFEPIFGETQEIVFAVCDAHVRSHTAHIPVRVQ